MNYLFHKVFSKTTEQNCSSTSKYIEAIMTQQMSHKNKKKCYRFQNGFMNSLVHGRLSPSNYIMESS
jgi:hypothetical protein